MYRRTLVGNMHCAEVCVCDVRAGFGCIVRNGSVDRFVRLWNSSRSAECLP